MSYDIAFKVKVENSDCWISIADYATCCLNTTWNVGTMIRESTGLIWKNEADNGLVKDIIPNILTGMAELSRNPEKYKQYEAPNGWGTVQSTYTFFNQIVQAWKQVCEDPEYTYLTDYIHFWVE